MKYEIIESKDQYSEDFDKLVNHPVQTWAWGDFRKMCGRQVVRVVGKSRSGELKRAYTFTFRTLPMVPYTIVHCLKCTEPTQELIDFARELAAQYNALYVKFEPDVIVKSWPNKKGKLNKDQVRDVNNLDSEKLGLNRSDDEIFSNYSFILDLNQSEEDLMMNMHSKTRYNVRLAKRKGVKVTQLNNDEGLEIFLDLNSKTTERQDYFLHNDEYFRNMWEILGPTGMMKVLVAKYEGENLCSWILFKHNETFYYPYGASSSKHRDVMASNLVCWEAIKLGKDLGCSEFDLWGALGPDADRSNSWYGFHRFKRGYGADLVEFAGSLDLVMKRPLYKGFKFANKVRWRLLKLFG